MTINKKLLVGFSSMVGILVLLGGLSWYYMNKMNSATDEIAHWRMPVLKSAVSVNNAALESTLGAVQFVFMSSEEGITYAESRAKGVSASLESTAQIAEQYEDNALSEGVTAVNNNVNQLLTIYGEIKSVKQALNEAERKMEANGKAVLAATSDFLQYVESESKKLYEKAISQFEVAAFVQKYNKVNQLTRKIHTLFELDKREQLVRDRTNYQALKVTLEETVYLLEDLEIISVEDAEISKIQLAIKSLNNYGQAAEAWVVQDDVMKEKFDQLQAASEGMRAISDQAQQESWVQVESLSEKSVALAQQGTLTIIASVALGVFIGLLTAILVPKSIKSSLEALGDFAKRFGRGDLTARVELKGKDEIAVIGSQFNLAAETLSDIIARLGETSSSLTETSVTLNENAERATQGAEVQRANTESVAAAMTEMAGSAEEVSANASSAAEAADVANSTATEGKAVFDTAIGSINALAEEVGRAMEVIRRLESDANGISGVLEVISSISEQTNLLALNAAIEAARAGEQGRGFAVVAEEVRFLATRTQESTEEIQKMIERLQSGAQEAVKVMTASHEKAEESVNKTSESDEALEAIANAVSSINQMNSQIAHGMQEQAIVVQEINKNIEQISAISEGSLNDTQQTSAASHALADLAEQLRSTVQLFKLG